MPDPTDHYVRLGLARQATPEEIRKAYFEAAQRYHPDKNVALGETEFFLDIQQAYEVLSNPGRRAQYDATLPPETPNLSPVLPKVLFSRQNILPIKEPQLIYVLLELTPAANFEDLPTPPLNLCLVLDRSTSMQGQKMDVVKATAIQIMRRLRPQDILSVVAFSDRAETLIASARNIDLSKAEARIQMLHTSGGTEIFNGLEAGFNEVRRNFQSNYVNHLILITDGHTYGDEQKCFELADKSAQKNIGISGLGIGHEWNDGFLDGITACTGGSSMYVARPQDIQHLLLEKFNCLWQVFADNVALEFEIAPNVELRYAFRLQPEVGLLPLESPMHWGPVLRETSLKVLLEFSVQPEMERQEVAALLDGELKITISARPVPTPPLKISLARPVAPSDRPEPPPTEIVQALSRLALYRLQEQARLEVTAGEYERASQRLQRLATNLISQGERGLARTVLLEADHVQREKSFSKEGDKRIKYGTRALLLPGTEKVK